MAFNFILYHFHAICSMPKRHCLEKIDSPESHALQLPEMGVRSVEKEWERHRIQDG